MKLEVGQKIGIYQYNGNQRSNGGLIQNGKQYLSEEHVVGKFKTGVSICSSPDNKIFYKYFMRHSEVRKVGSLIVKRLK